MKRRLLSQETVDSHAAEISAAMQAASTRMRRSVAQALTANGLTWDDPARSSPATIFDPGAWAAAVNAEVAPVARKIAQQTWNATRAKVLTRAVAGAPNPVDRLTAMIVDRALQGGSGISRRMGTLAVTAAGVDLQSVMEKINAAPDLRLHEGNQPTLGSAYQQAYDQLDQLVARTGAHLSDAAASILGETAQANTGATISHVWTSALSPTTREDHADADGQEQNAGDPFDVGGEALMYPGDPSGSDGNVINCMCWLETNVLDVAGEAEASDVA